MNGDESSQEFHTRRARQELDLAYRSAVNKVAEIHLLLSSLHMQKLRELQSRAAPLDFRSGLSPSKGHSVAMFEQRVEAREFETLSG